MSDRVMWGDSTPIGDRAALVFDSFQRPFATAPRVLALDARPRPPKRTADDHLIGRGIRPSAAVADAYRAKLLRLVDEMSNSVRYWIGANYRKQDERIAALAGLAEDAPPSAALQVVVDRLRRRWLGRFDDASTELARYFAKQVHRRSDDELRKILRRAGISVKFRISTEVRDALRAVVAENVSLIRSIPEQFLTQVEGSVMRSVLAGRDLSVLTDDLQYQHGVTRRRAELISRDQNAKASGAIQRLQYMEIGISRAIWHHSHAGKTPRPAHVAMDGKEYSVQQGMWDSHEQRYVQCGELVNCRCFNSPVMPR